MVWIKVKEQGYLARNFSNISNLSRGSSYLQNSHIVTKLGDNETPTSILLKMICDIIDLQNLNF